MTICESPLTNVKKEALPPGKTLFLLCMLQRNDCCALMWQTSYFSPFLGYVGQAGSKTCLIQNDSRVLFDFQPKPNQPKKIRKEKYKPGVESIDKLFRIKADG